MNEHSLVRVMTALVMEPWLLTPSMHKTLCDIVTAHVINPQQQHALASAMPQNPSPRQFAVRGDQVAIIPVDGVIGRKFSSSLYSSGVTSVDVLARLVDMAAADEEVNAILMVYDSPGGTVQGVAECGNAITRARASKPVLAYADGQMCSAAYWLASQSSTIYAWDESAIGSIGVYSAFLDRSREMEMAGIKPVIFKSGDHKAMGFPGTSLTDKEREMIQARVDEIGAKFRATVNSGRARAIADDVMQGQSFTAAESLANGLIDTVSDFGTALSDAGKLGRMEKQKKGK
jgi:signal peptide peptidase SppA